MLYTIAGLTVGLIISHLYCGLTGVSDSRGSGFGPSARGLTVFFGMVIGGAIGFGYGLSKLASGSYLN